MARLASLWGDLEHEPEVHLRVQAVHAPEGLCVDPAGDHLRPKVDPAAGEVHDEGGLSPFFHDRRSNVGPVNQAGSKPSDSPLGAPAKGASSVDMRPLTVATLTPQKGRFRGRKGGEGRGEGPLPGGEGGVGVPPGSTVRILDAEAGRAPKGG